LGGGGVDDTPSQHQS